MLAKDALNETLAADLSTRGRDDSRRLGVAVFALLGTLVRESLRGGVWLIVEGNLAPGTRSSPS